MSALPDTVRFEETGATRDVIGYCKRCRRTWLGDRDESYAVVSPAGIAHIGCDLGETACGIDATGDKWWWEL